MTAVAMATPLTLLVLVAGACERRRDRAPGTPATGVQATAGESAAPQRPCRIQLAPVGDGRLGVLAVGMSLQSLRAACPAAIEISATDEEGAAETRFALPVTDRDTVFAAIDTVRGRTVVRWFSVLFPGPRTDQAIGVGSTYQQVKAAYPRLQANDNEGTVYVWPEPDRGISVALSVNLDALDPRWRVQPAIIPDTAHVTELLVRAPLPPP